MGKCKNSQVLPGKTHFFKAIHIYYYIILAYIHKICDTQCNIHTLHKRILQGFCILLFSVIYWRPTSSSRQRCDQWRLLLSTAVQCDAVLLGDGCQLFQELSIQDDGKHSAFGLRGNGWAGRQDTQRRQRQSVPQGAVGQGRVQDEVPSLRLEAF